MCQTPTWCRCEGVGSCTGDCLFILFSRFVHEARDRRLLLFLVLTAAVACRVAFVWVGRRPTHFTFMRAARIYRNRTFYRVGSFAAASSLAL